MPDPNISYAIPRLRLFGAATRPSTNRLRSSFIPSLMGMCRNPQDQDLQLLMQNLKVTPSDLTKRYDSLSLRTRGERYGVDHQRAAGYTGTLKDLMDRSLREMAKEIQTERLRSKQAIRAELAKLATLPPAKVMELIPKSFLEFTAIQRYWGQYYAKDCCHSRPGPQQPPAAPKSFALKVTELFCSQTEDSGEDEIYLVSVAVDGKGNVIANQSPIWDMNEDDSSREKVFPHWYVYPMKDPGGFLDASIQMYDEDGNYSKVGQAITAVGGLVTSIGSATNPYVAIAGAIITVAGQITEIIQSGDEDDDLGVVNLEFRNQQELTSRIGTLTGSYTGDDANYDAKFELLTV